MTQPYKRIIALDMETAWCSKTYTLSKTTVEEYVRSPKFKAWGCAYLWLDEPEATPKWVSRKDLAAFFAGIPWEDTAVVAHNSQFDVSILAWIYGHVPCFILDTLSMARALYGTEVGNSLKMLAQRFNLPPKGDAIHSTDGILDTLPLNVEQELGPYCEHDVWLCVALFDRFFKDFPAKELRLIDMTLKMFVEPVLQLDKLMLIEAIGEEKEKREGLLKRLGIEASELASNPKFAVVLRKMGIEPPMKNKKATKKTPNPVGKTYAFAKSDALFQPLINHDNEEIALLCEARLAVKSTLERTRGQRFLDIAQRGTLPVPLTYYGAHTGRWTASKGSGLNMQNLKRGSFLRNALMAPEGYVLVVVDLSQIEARVLAWLADYRDMLQIFASGADPYAIFGAIMFGIKGMTKDSHPLHRQSAKSAVLGAGYGLGWANFSGQLLTGFLGADPVLYGISFAKQLRIGVEQVERFVTDEENMKKMVDIPRICTNDELAVHCTVAKTIIDLYRNAAKPVTKLWRVCDDYISKCLVSDEAVTRFGGGKELQLKCFTFKPGEILLPNGMSLKYPELQGKSDEKGRVQWTYESGKGRVKLYGAKIVENVTQALARIVMTDGMLRIQKRYPCILTVHDEVALLVPEGEAQEAQLWAHEQMTKEPKYMPGIPLDAEVGAGKRYGECKQ